MTDRSVELLLKSSELRVRVSCNLRDNTARCLKRSMRAIVESKRLLASSKALLSCPQPVALGTLTPPLKEFADSKAGMLQTISDHDFDTQIVATDGKHFSGCSFQNCTLLYSGSHIIFESCEFHGCNFEFSGAAGRAIQFLDCFGLLAGHAADQPSSSSTSLPALVN